MLSKACKYGIKATLFLAQQSKEGRMSNVREIAEAIGSPEAFTAKVLQQLVRCAIISSVKGAKGGFFIEEHRLSTLNLLQIVVAIDGRGLIENCMLGLSECSESRPCPVHRQFRWIKQDIVHMLCKSMVNELTMDVALNLAVLKN
ncbi:RrF2 family transcriptional regulator [Chitinophaga flava]|uniref:Transcriptional regulator n=1 Tax=Chitinophaga flava TaxID=2259036 RepID=A0A365Y1B0_9BACT|nr:Rrf2 family transcriptional regulator [Chitinophaga flava]RBL91704.1 transcriptional regulator [Chitinophaga flava]